MPRHGAPWMVVRGWLWKPHISTISSQLSRLEGLAYCMCVANLATSGIDKIGAWFHVANHVLVKEILSLGMEGTIDCDNVTDLDHVLDSLMEGKLQLFLDFSR